MSWKDTSRNGRIGDEDIDALFKGANPVVPEFREEFWDEMEAMLPAEKRKRKGLLWFSVIAAVLLAIGGTAWMLASGNVQPGTGEDALTATDTDAAISPVGTGNASAARAMGNTHIAVAGHSIANKTVPNPSAASRPANRTNTSGLELPGGSTGPIVTPIVESTVNTASGKPEAGLQAREWVAFFYLPYRTVQATAKSPRLGDPVIVAPTQRERFYGQVSAGIGQSAQENVTGASDFLHCYALGGGLYKRIDRMVLTLGVQARMDVSSNLIHSESVSATTIAQTHYNQLYALETPLSIGFISGKNTFALTMSPGFQTAFSGKVIEYEQETAVRSGRASGKVHDGKTLTMEAGIQYQRKLQPGWYLGLGLNVDAIRPFSTAAFSGDQRLLPVNGQLMLRKVF